LYREKIPLYPPLKKGEKSGIQEIIDNTSFPRYITIFAIKSNAFNFLTASSSFYPSPDKSSYLSP
jgi:hypothetical protein